MKRSSAIGFLAASSLLGPAVIVAACATSREPLATPDAGSEGGSGLDGGFNADVGDVTPPPSTETRDPVDCEEAKSSKS